MNKREEREAKQLIHDIFVTALEGGIQYWASVDEYRWAEPGTNTLSVEKAADLDGFYALIRDREDEDKVHRVDAAVIRRGVREVAFRNSVHVAPDCRDRARRVVFGDEDVDYDAADADAFLQAGLFGDVVYG